jgi:hypothetical protein
MRAGQKMPQENAEGNPREVEAYGGRCPHRWIPVETETHAGRKTLKLASRAF